MFLCLSDFSVFVKDAELIQIATGFDTNIVRQAIEKAIAETKAYLNFKYDVVAIFTVSAYDFSIIQAYKTGDVIIDSDGIAYTCTSDAAANTPLTNTNYFAVGDLRDGLIVMIICDIAIYHFHARIAQQHVPEHRTNRYNEAIEKLRQIRKSTLNPELPLLNQSVLTETQQTHTIKIISRPPQNYYYD